MALLNVGYHLLLQSVLHTQEEEDARQKVLTKLRNLEYEHDTGMPAITQWMRPANEM